MAEKIFLTVVIPCYNEQENLERGVLKEVATVLDKFKFSYEVLVSDDASSDQSLSLAKKFKHSNFRILENEHGGKAYALRAGLKEARGEYVLFTDMDQSTPIQELEKLLPAIEKGEKVVIGSRGRQRANFNLTRQLASQIFSLVRRSILLPQIVDTQCGFKMFDRELAIKIFEKMQIFENNGKAKGWTVAAWDVEFLFLAEKMGYKIVEVPAETRQYGQYCFITKACRKTK